MQADKDPVVPVAAPDRSTLPSARRRLLRGTFAAPTVLALSSGSALANTSSLRCFNNMPNEINDFKPAGNFFQVDRYSHNGIALVDAEAIREIAKNQKFDAGVFAALSASTGGSDWFAVSTLTRYSITSNDPVQVPTKDMKRSVALRFLRVGDSIPPVLSIVGLSDNGAKFGELGGKVLSGSCWTSFAPPRAAL